jgi:hypothetical protein
MSTILIGWPRNRGTGTAIDREAASGINDAALQQKPETAVKNGFLGEQDLERRGHVVEITMRETYVSHIFEATAAPRVHGRRNGPKKTSRYPAADPLAKV